MTKRCRIQKLISYGFKDFLISLLYCIDYMTDLPHLKKCIEASHTEKKHLWYQELFIWKMFKQAN